jgi:hypothetical protein
MKAVGAELLQYTGSVSAWKTRYFRLRKNVFFDSY